MANYRAEAAATEILYGDTPTAFGVPSVDPADLHGIDIAISGVPWEGSPTWAGWTGCIIAPKTIRDASVRLSGFQPEYGIDAFEWLTLGDCGDVVVNMQDQPGSFISIERHIAKIINGGAFPLTFGGDHSIAYPIVKAITETTGKRIGVVHLDAHFDNKDVYEGDRFARNCQFHRMAELDLVDPTTIVHTGIRGPRNTKGQWEYAREVGAQILTINDVRDRGIEAIIKEAHALASKGTDGVYVSICSDVIEAAFNPGGPPDPNGLTTYELFRAVRYLGQQSNLVGYDHCEVLPPLDPTSLASHTAAWAAIYMLGGMASRLKEDREQGDKSISLTESTINA
ncbi:agmatinase family protein [Arthrobacter sp. ISL-28]|uniref:agmatinase family protein n=1 Tax=Arthrobacter sp. ISL-28 TaxID=2819108 RepID=UPI001BE86C5A|nr:agmatinase family protein [Arthrobacter sp. ISL-28]MBT2520164.1 agmatinase family protein [Arthrobacter sp. ISL-28]